MSEKLCPCGRPARRKYCCDKCKFKYASQNWQRKNRDYLAAKRKAEYRAKHPKSATCPCGNPCTRYKYCSQVCMNRYASRTWYDNNRERALATAKRHSQTDRGRRTRRSYKRREFARIREYMAAWRSANKGKMTAQHRRWIERNPDKVSLYLERQRWKRLRLSLSLLAVAVGSRLSTTSGKPSPPKRRKN